MSPRITVLSAALMLSAAHAMPAMPMNAVMTVHGVKAVCSGIGANAERDARFNAYPLRIELAGKLGQYLAGADFTITHKRRTLIDIRCAGPWLFVKLEPGRYRVTAKRRGKTATSLAWASAKGQGRVVLRFPQQGGTVSAEYLKSLRQQASAAPAETPQVHAVTKRKRHVPTVTAEKSHHRHRLAAKTEKHRHTARVARSH